MIRKIFPKFLFVLFDMYKRYESKNFIWIYILRIFFRYLYKYSQHRNLHHIFIHTFIDHIFISLKYIKERGRWRERERQSFSYNCLKKRILKTIGICYKFYSKVFLQVRVTLYVWYINNTNNIIHIYFYNVVYNTTIEISFWKNGLVDNN